MENSGLVEAGRERNLKKRKIFFFSNKEKISVNKEILKYWREENGSTKEKKLI